MITLTSVNLIYYFLINLIFVAVIIYVTSYARRRAELSAEESSDDKKYFKKTIREAISETRSVLTELRVHEFQVPTGRRRLSRMNSLIENLSLADDKLGLMVWNLVNAPIFLDVIDKTYKGMKSDPEVIKYKLKIKENYFKDLKWALKRCAELEKNPIVNK